MRVATILLPVLLLAGAPVLAQFKVVGPDGRVTYSDRPPADAGSRVVPLGRTAPPAEAPPLPLELRQASARYPVTLFTTGDCAPCDNGRRLLQQRGIPYSERLVANDEDLAVLSRLTAARTVPALTIGAQALRGYLESDWQSYLDAAGYPRESRLPRDYQPPAATPLAPRAAPVDEPRTPAPRAAPLPAVVAEPLPSGIRF